MFGIGYRYCRCLRRRRRTAAAAATNALALAKPLFYLYPLYSISQFWPFLPIYLCLTDNQREIIILLLFISLIL